MLMAARNLPGEEETSGLYLGIAEGSWRFMAEV